MFDTLHDAVEAFTLSHEPAARPLADLAESMAACIDKLTDYLAGCDTGSVGALYAQQELTAVAQMRDQLLADVASAAMAKWHEDRRRTRPVGVKRPGLIRSSHNAGKVG